MARMRWRAAGSVAGALVSLGGTAMGQPCSASWSGAIGSPGLGDGYAGPMYNRVEGGVAVLYVGGSYTRIGGLATRGVARWNPATGVWSAVGGGCYSTFSNSFSAAITGYDFGAGPELVVGGGFSTAGGELDTINLARWDGSSWSGMPGGQPDGAVWAMQEWNGRLYVGGGFTTIGGIAASGIASYSAAEGWRPLGAGMGAGFSPAVFALKVFDDGTGEKLYAGGRFDSIGGVSGFIARWTGSAWQQIGMGVRGAVTFSGIEAIGVHEGKLYAGGWDLRPNGTGGTSSVVMWSGSTWSRAGQYLGGRTTSLLSWDDGSGARLYAGGTAQPNTAQLARLEGTVWVTVDGGMTEPALPPATFPSVFGLFVLGDDLVVGGSFTQAGATPASGLVIRAACVRCAADFNGDGVVDFADFLAFLNLYDAQDPRADLNGDGVVDFADYLEFLNLYDAGC
ncbi:MAG: hypothetical protein IT436_00540 [Phycisphaerales bacterium]|nr:hypothetical protein [Phycisphaerales bacterium]